MLAFNYIENGPLQSQNGWYLCRIFLELTDIFPFMPMMILLSDNQRPFFSVVEAFSDINDPNSLISDLPYSNLFFLRIQISTFLSVFHRFLLGLIWIFWFPINATLLYFYVRGLNGANHRRKRAKNIIDKTEEKYWSATSKYQPTSVRHGPTLNQYLYSERK